MSRTAAQRTFPAPSSLPRLKDLSAATGGNAKATDAARGAEARAEFGVVVAKEGSSVQVRTEHGENRADVAASCLRSPSLGDRVLLVQQGQESYVLAVLKSREPEAQLVFEGDVSFSVPKGRLNLLVQEGLSVSSPKATLLQMGDVSADAEDLRVGFRGFNLIGKTLSVKTQQVRLVAEAFDTLASRIYQRAVNFLRRTDELDRVEAKNIDRRAEQLLHIHGENTVTTAEHLAKIDASQVHVG